MKNKGVIFVHLAIWALPCLLLARGVFSGVEPPTAKDVVWALVYPLVTMLSAFYINYVLLIPQFITKQKRFGMYMVSFFSVLGLLVAIRSIVAVLYPEMVLMREGPPGQTHTLSLEGYAATQAFMLGFLMVFSLLIKLTIDWFSNERVQRNLENEKREMELQFLKSQLNPHFLFNSLNNIYSLAYQKSEKTADAILKLSEIMRYMIYESNDLSSDLSKEIEYLKNYIELHRLRYKDGGAVELQLAGEIDGQRIVPLILISFVENAFKHGVANDPADPIKINIIANQKILHFSITNKKNKDNYKDQVGGVGLSNVERRLQLMYPDRYKLNIVNSATHYTTELMLDL